MLTLMTSVSDNVSSSVCWPTTFRRVVWAIWLIAAATFSIANRLHRIDNPVVSDGRDVDADVIVLLAIGLVVHCGCQQIAVHLSRDLISSRTETLTGCAYTGHYRLVRTSSPRTRATMISMPVLKTVQTPPEVPGLSWRPGWPR